MKIKLFPDIKSTLVAVLGPEPQPLACGCPDGYSPARNCGCYKWKLQFVSPDRNCYNCIINWCFCECHPN